MSRRLIVLEVNELPRRVVEWWIEHAPAGGLAALVSAGQLVDTVLDEELPRDLYPSQSWASVSTGVPWADHGVFWYGDPKPAQYPLYWQAAARAGRTVGVVGSLHSSPLGPPDVDPDLLFVIPDAFAATDDTRPDDLRPLQALNLRASRRSGRVASLRPTAADAAALGSVVRSGLSPATTARLGGLAASVAGGRVSRERLRAGQTMLLGDVFRRQIRRFDPDLAVTFTNHVAAAMHRYWAATFPEDYPAPPYDAAWRSAHADELPFAMRVLDREIARTAALASRTGRELVVISSMGQHADVDLDTSVTRQAVVRDGSAFLRALGIDTDDAVNAAMVPQMTIDATDASAALQLAETLRERLGIAAREVMVADRAVTLTYGLTVIDTDEGTCVELGRRIVAPETAGVSIERISDHRSGRHSPLGVLLTDRPSGLPSTVDAFSIAPWILRQLGLEPLAHHRDVPEHGGGRSSSDSGDCSTVGS